MTDIFLSYKREDQARVALIVNGLRAAGLAVWWDQDVPGGESWRQETTKHLDSARCVIVVWSKKSVSPIAGFVHDEAGRAKARGVLLPVRIDRIREPIGFGEIQSLDLVGWRGSRKDRRFRYLVETAKAFVAGERRPKPQVLWLRARIVALGMAALIGIAGVIGFASDLFGIQDILCRIPGVHRACASWGLGGVPTSEETELWAVRVPGDCEGLRTYLQRFPKGALAEEAAHRLQAARTEEHEVWTPQEQRLPLVVRTSLKALATEKAARADALQRGQVEAARLCEPLKMGGFRVVSTMAVAETWRCQPRSGGTVCGLDGLVNCKLEERRVQTRELCP